MQPPPGNVRGAAGEPLQFAQPRGPLIAYGIYLVERTGACGEYSPGARRAVSGIAIRFASLNNVARHQYCLCQRRYAGAAQRSYGTITSICRSAVVLPVRAVHLSCFQSMSMCSGCCSRPLRLSDRASEPMSRRFPRAAWLTSSGSIARVFTDSAGPCGTKRSERPEPSTARHSTITPCRTRARRTPAFTRRRVDAERAFHEQERRGKHGTSLACVVCGPHQL